MLVKKTLKILLFLLFIEFVFRVGLSVSFGQIIFTSKDLYYKYYPELKKTKKYAYDTDKKNILILGGSVVSNDSSAYPINDSIWVSTTYCNFNDLLDSSKFNVLSLARSAHNSLDSKIKYSLLKNIKFDYVFIYHGLNDNRANNTFANHFDKNYRHIEFYDDLFVINSFPKKPFLATLFLPRWIIHKTSKKNKNYIPKELFWGLLKGEPEESVKEGRDIKSAITFLENYKTMKELADKRHQKMIVSTYAWYIAKDYTLEKFKAQSLDYDQQIYPIELYGLPKNIKKGLIKHNSLLKEFSNENTDIIFFDFNTQIEKSSKYFNDICHFNDAGCTKLSNRLTEVINAH